MALTTGRRWASDAPAQIPTPASEWRADPAAGALLNVLGERPPTPALERALNNVGISLQDDLIRAICEGLRLDDAPFGASSRPVKAGPAPFTPAPDPTSSAARFEPLPPSRIEAPAMRQPARLSGAFAPAPAGIGPTISAIAPASAGIAPLPPPAFPGRAERPGKASNARAEARRMRAGALRNRENEAKRLAVLATARTRRSIREEAAERLQVLEKAMRTLHLDHTMVTYRGSERQIVSWWMAAEFVKREGRLSLMKLAKFRTNELRRGPPLPKIDEPDPAKRALKQKEWARAGLKKVRYLERDGGPWHRFKTERPEEDDAAADIRSVLPSDRIITNRKMRQMPMR